MSSEKNRYKEEREIRAEVAEATGLGSGLAKVQQFLQGKISADDIKPKSQSRGKKDSDEFPAEFRSLAGQENISIDAGDLASKIRADTSRSNIEDPTEGDFVTSKSGQMVLRRKASRNKDSEINVQNVVSNYSLHSYDMNKLVNEVNKYNFSPEKREYEIEEIRKAISSVIDRLKIEKIADSSQKVSKNLQKFYKTSSNGVRAVFGVLGQNISLKAEGEFNGEEALYLVVEGNDLMGVVLRKDPYKNEFVNVSDQFSIEVQKINS